MDSEDKGNIGIDELSSAIRKLGYKFRRQFESDYGIDAHIEIRVAELYPTGKLIGVQVKVDKSDCTEAKEHYNFTSDYTHLNYWLNHSLPVIIVHYDTQKDMLNWVHVTEDNIVRNPQSWSIKIPQKNIINNSCKYELAQIADKIDIQTRKYNILQESLVIMEYINKGYKVCIEYQDWINKTLAIRALRINVYSKKEEILESIEWPFDVFPNDLEKGLENMFPWATFENDFSEDDEDDDLKYEYMNEYGYRDEKYIDWNDYIEWKEHRLDSLGNIRPYKNEANEVDFYRIRVNLNELGQSFLRLNQYLDSIDEFIR